MDTPHVVHRIEKHLEASDFLQLSGTSGHSGNSISIGAIVGGAVGGAVVLFGIVGLVLYYIYVYAPKRRSKNRKLSDHLGFGGARRPANDQLLKC